MGYLLRAFRPSLGGCCDIPGTVPLSQTGQSRGNSTVELERILESRGDAPCVSGSSLYFLMYPYSH